MVVNGERRMALFRGGKVPSLLGLSVLLSAGAAASEKSIITIFMKKRKNMRHLSMSVLCVSQFFAL